MLIRDASVMLRTINMDNLTLCTNYSIQLVKLSSISYHGMVWYGMVWYGTGWYAYVRMSMRTP